MQLHHRRLLLTSHVLCDAWAFGRKGHTTPSGCAYSPTAAFLFCTAALKRVMLPNICIQGPELSVKKLDLFLHDSVRPFTMSFVFKLSFWCPADGFEPTALVSLMQRISATMPYLEKLHIGIMPRLGEHASAFVAALPSSSLRVLQLMGSGWPPEGRNEDDVLALSKFPFLEEFECSLSGSGLEALSPLTLPASGGASPFFPRLRLLAIRVWDGFESTLELYQRVLQSPLVKQLRALSCSLRNEAVNSTPGSISLESLARVERLSRFLKYCNFSAAPCFSLLENCRDLGDMFLRDSTLPPGAVDLSGMHVLESIGASAFCCTQVTSIIIPSSLMFVGMEFCANSSITELDLSPCAQSLKFVATECFLCECSSLKKFDTTPLLGSVGSHVGAYFMEGCVMLMEVDLAGLKNATSLGDSFLRDCTSLRNVSGCDGLSSVESIGDAFLCGTFALEECGFLQLVALRECGECFLAGSALESHGKKILEEIMERNNKQEEDQSVKSE